jgi:AraC-like DNA-binding protein
MMSETNSQFPDPLLQERYRQLTRKHLTGLCERLFAEFTGLRFHIAWAPSPPYGWDAKALPAGCALWRHGMGAKGRPPELCRSCGPKHLARALNGRGRGRHFTCRLGLRNYWFPIRVRGLTVGLAYLQALASRSSGKAAPQRSAGAGAKLLPQSDFRRAGRLLRLIVQYAQIQDLAQLRKDDLAHVSHAVTALETEQARLHGELGRLVPLSAVTLSAARPETHAQQLVQAALEIVHQNYSRPLTLAECARRLRMNASYLCDLFSRAVRMPFKAYLTELRLEKAKQLLADPARNISEVALATGYGSENRFRKVFKRATGLSPKSWRETFYLATPVFFGWLAASQELLEAAGSVVI